MKVFIAHSVRDSDLVESLVTILREDGHEVCVPTEMQSGENVLSEISAAIRSVDVLIAVVKSGNPNIFYELGLAAGASVPTLITAPNSELLPADLASVPYVQLTGEVLRDAQTIARRVKDFEILKPKKATKFTSAEAALRAATSDPAVLESLSNADFEQLVIDLFKERGYEVTSTPYERDTGYDFIVKYHKDKELALVELKKLSRQSRVSVETVRRLLSVVYTVGAPMGMLIATSGYTAAALALSVGTPIILRTLQEILVTKSEKGFVLAPLLERQGLGRRQAQSAVDAAIAWLKEHGTDSEATFVLKPLLGRNDLEREQAQSAVDAAMVWLKEHGTDPEATFVFNTLLARYDLEREQAQSAVDAAMAWLKEHGTDSEATFVLKPLLWRDDLERGQAQYAVHLAMDWLKVHGTDRDAQFVFNALLGRDDLEREQAQYAVHLAMDWLKVHGTDRDAQFVFKTLLGRDDLERGQAQYANDIAMAWLKVHGTNPGVQFVLPPGDPPPPKE